MIAADTAKGKRIALFGLGGSGLATAKSLMAADAELFCHDDNPQQVAEAAAAGISTADLRTIDFTTIDELVLAPGVPLTHPQPHWSVEKANAAGVPIIGDIELFCRERRAKAPDCPFVAITGTNGKSTTTALIGHVFGAAGCDIQLGGNIGTAILSLEEPAAGRVYVVECSSFQIDLAPRLDPSVAILLNLAPDHLDRHGTMENYAAIKKRLVEAAKLSVVGTDDRHSAAIASRLEEAGHEVIRISSEHILPEGYFLDQGELIEAHEGSLREVFAMADAPALRGNHNAQNAAAAFVACLHSGLAEDDILQGFTGFPGLAHRMEPLGRVGRVLYVNDSKGTNTDAAAHALASFERIYWIAGGLAKDGGIDDLRRFFPRIARAYLIGQDAPAFAVTLGSKVPFEIAGTIDVAVNRAAEDAARDNHGEPVVLLSPACASFDQFSNFENRGEAFRSAVEALDGFVSFGEASQ